MIQTNTGVMFAKAKREKQLYSGQLIVHVWGYYEFEAIVGDI